MIADPFLLCPAYYSVRSGHADIASTASLLGGVVAQEAIKLITKQVSTSQTSRSIPLLALVLMLNFSTSFPVHSFGGHRHL